MPRLVIMKLKNSPDPSPKTHVCRLVCVWLFFFQAEDGIRDLTVTGVQTCALPIYRICGYRKCDQSHEMFRELGLSRNREQRWTTSNAFARAVCRHRLTPCADRDLGADRKSVV